MPLDNVRPANLDGFMRDLKAVFAKHGLTEPALAIAFTVEEDDWKQVHWATNVSREDGIALFKDTAAKMIAKSN